MNKLFSIVKTPLYHCLKVRKALKRYCASEGSITLEQAVHRLVVEGLKNKGFLKDAPVFRKK